MISLLIINPNSTTSITQGLSEGLDSICPPETKLTYYTAPPNAPAAISDGRTGILTAAACYEDLVAKKLLDGDEFDGFLVCCFSNHPLTDMLREHFGLMSKKSCIGIFDGGVAHALMTGGKFGVLSTGTGPKPLLTKGVSTFLGASGSDRWAGVVTSGLGVVELREGDRKRVEELMKKGAAKVAALGAQTIVMGCAAMTGMEGLVQEGVREVGLGEIKVIDGVRAGMEVLVGLCRRNKQ